MFVKDLTLRNYRNYEELNISFNKNFNVIHGLNGQGKTNILEAIFLCATGKSHRTSHDVDLINYGADFFNIDLNLVDDIGDRNINYSYNRTKQKIIKVNDIYLRKIGNLMGNLVAVLFSPEDLMIVKQGPALRRRFIDISLSQIRSSYFFDLQQYNKTIRQRNALLKQIKYDKSLKSTIDIWNNNLAQIGSNIIYRRIRFVDKLSELVSQKHYFISNERENLELNYKSSVLSSEPTDRSSMLSLSKEDIFNIYYKKLTNYTDSDIEREVTFYGPHRDDFIYILNGNDLKLFGSQGQQRTAVLSSKLAELDIMKFETDKTPILLLDDVLSELDNNRQEYLFAKLADTQTFITCTDKNNVKTRLNFDATYYLVSSGEITAVENLV